MSIYDYDPDQKPKTSKEQRDEMMKKFLEKGGKVQETRTWLSYKRRQFR